MIKAQELRIGNLISTKFNDAPFHEIVALHKVGAKFTYPENREASASYEYISGIPLTEEWLLKGGYKQHADKLTYSKLITELDMLITLIDFIGSFNLCLSGPFGMVTVGAVAFIHDLQNKEFALTGQELTFDK
jgi:hypothetical protein